VTVDVEIVAQADVFVPRSARPGDAGMDLRSVIACEIDPLGRALIPVGVKLAIPQGYVGLVLPRSGLALMHGVSVLNAPGCIDPGYRGDVGVVLVNLGEEVFVVQVGDRIAQLVISPIVMPRWIEVESLTATHRAGEGFGSTGRE
jgi:dUTP pyrophosphatase